MENNITEIVFIMDKSGSMAHMVEDTVGGFNATLERQRGEEGEAYVTTVLFSNRAKIFHDRVPIGEIEPMSISDYTVGGNTALMDAIGETIKHIETVHKYIRREDLPRRTVFVIITDGMENASRTYKKSLVKQLIEKKTVVDGWDFIFLASDIDAVNGAADMGISPSHLASFDQTAEGWRVCHAYAAEAVHRVRQNMAIGSDWCGSRTTENKD